MWSFRVIIIGCWLFLLWQSLRTHFSLSFIFFFFDYMYGENETIPRNHQSVCLPIWNLSYQLINEINFPIRLFFSFFFGFKSVSYFCTEDNHFLCVCARAEGIGAWNWKQESRMAEDEHTHTNRERKRKKKPKIKQNCSIERGKV